jgi:hypothetical protein
MGLRGCGAVQAAKVCRSNERYVQAAESIEVKAPEPREQVKAGTRTIPQARRAVNRREQRDARAAEAAAVQAAALPIRFHGAAGARPSDRQVKDDDRRADPGGRLRDDVRGIHPRIPRRTGTSAERPPDSPTRLPLALLAAVIGSASEPGDRVLDPSAGRRRWPRRASGRVAVTPVWIGPKSLPDGRGRGRPESKEMTMSKFKRLFEELRACNCKLDPIQFRLVLAALFVNCSEYKTNIKELLRHNPRWAVRFCDSVRSQTRCYELSDELILRTLQELGEFCDIVRSKMGYHRLRDFVILCALDEELIKS